MKTTDVCEGNAIFLIGRPESHIKNITLDNVQISAQKGIDIRFVDNLVFKNNSKIKASSNTLWIKKYASTVDEQCNATGLTPSGISTINYKNNKDNYKEWCDDNNNSNDNNYHNLYSLNGKMVKTNTSSDDIKKLNKGMYIINKKKFIKK